MKHTTILFLLALLMGCQTSGEQTASRADETTDKLEPLLGTWVKVGPSGPVHLEFSSDSTVQGDFGGDGAIDITSRFILDGNEISFQDRSGRTCPEKGKYQIDIQDHYLAFNIIQDECIGRVQTTLGFWTRMDHAERVKDLEAQMAQSHDPALSLTRGRVYLALGETEKARADFDHYLAHDTTDARAYVNRAATRFPDDMMGIIHDCDRATAIDPNLTNAYFLRGLALKSLRNPKRACSDFQRAIELGFTLLQSAEKASCADYWENG